MMETEVPRPQRAVVADLVARVGDHELTHLHAENIMPRHHRINIRRYGTQVFANDLSSMAV